MAEYKGKVLITENYRDYVPPFDAKDVVSVLLSSVSPDYLVGLHEVVLTNSARLNRQGRRCRILRRNQKVAYQDCLGAYSRKRRKEPATIELFVDNIVGEIPAWLFKFPMVRKGVFSGVLFHELGHHLHATSAPEHNEKEDVADKWSKKLTREFMRRHYWYLIPVVRLVRAVKFLKRKIVGTAT